MVVSDVKRDKGSRRIAAKNSARGVIGKNVAVLIAGFAALQTVLFLLLVAGQAVPDEPIVDNLVKAIDAGTYGPSGLPDRMGGVSDTFTECVVVGTGLGDGSPDDSPWEQAGYMPRISNCEGGVSDLRALAAGDTASQGQYYKYWAGYTSITRPALAMVGLEGLRILSGAMLVSSLIVALIAVAGRLNWWAAAALFGPLLLASNVFSTPSTSFSQAISISFIFLSTALAAYGAGRSTTRLIAFTGLGAALFCYVDLLTTPAIPWALASVVAAAVTFGHARNFKHGVLAGVIAAVVWPLAFALTWASRWAIAAMFLGFDKVVEHVAGNVEFRTGGDFGHVSDTFGASTLRNANYWWDRIPTSHIVLILVAAAAVLAIVLSVRRNGVSSILIGAVLAAPLLVIPIWYEVLRNHSQIHDFFAYRGIPVGFGIGLFALVVAASIQMKRVEVTTVRPHEPEKLVANTKERGDDELHR